MGNDRDKQGEPGEVGTELDLPELDSPAKPSSNMSFGMVELSGDAGAELELPTPEMVQDQPKPKSEPPSKPPDEPKIKSAPPVPKSKPSPESKHSPYTIRSRRTSTTPGRFPMARSSRIREEHTHTEHSSSGSRSIKIAIIVILVLALIGGGVYLFLRWQKNTEKKHQAEMERLNQQSRDSLMEDRFKNR